MPHSVVFWGSQFSEFLDLEVMGEFCFGLDPSGLREKLFGMVQIEGPYQDSSVFQLCLKNSSLGVVHSHSFGYTVRVRPSSCPCQGTG